MHQFVGVGDGGIGDELVLELHCVGKLFALGVLDVAVMCAIMFGGREEIPSIHQMICPCAAFVGLLMHLGLPSHRGEQHFVVVEWST